MLYWILGLIGTAVLLYSLHRLGLWMDRKGWLYYRTSSSSGSGSAALGSALQSVQSIYEPQVRYELESRQEQIEQDEEDLPVDPDEYFRDPTSRDSE